MDLNVIQIPALGDNYIYLLTWDDKALLIDPAAAAPALAALEKSGAELIAILNTHHHYDHVDGNLPIKKQTNCTIIGPDDPRVPGLDQPAYEGKDLQFNTLTIQVISVPGHTTSHIAFFIPETNWLFSGDSLFTGGCGRVFEGTYAQMLTSLQKLAALPKDTLVYCGHEYTQKNLEFAHSIEPNNPDIKQRLDQVKQKRSHQQPTVPSTIEEELRTNPFLRGADPALQQALNMEGATELQVFTKVRTLKDSF